MIVTFDIDDKQIRKIDQLVLRKPKLPFPTGNDDQDLKNFREYTRKLEEFTRADGTRYRSRGAAVRALLQKARDAKLTRIEELPPTPDKPGKKAVESLRKYAAEQKAKTKIK